MDISIIIFFELIFILLIGLVVYTSKKQRNFFLSYNLNLIVLCISIFKLFWLLWAFQQDTSLCDLSRKWYC